MDYLERQLAQIWKPFLEVEGVHIVKFADEGIFGDLLEEIEFWAIHSHPHHKNSVFFLSLVQVRELVECGEYLVSDQLEQFLLVDIWVEWDVREVILDTKFKMVPIRLAGGAVAVVSIVVLEHRLETKFNFLLG